MEDRYSTIEFSALVDKKGFQAALKEYSTLTGKHPEEIRRLYLLTADHVEDEGY